MNSKTLSTPAHEGDSLDLSAAVEQFVADGGVINIIHGGEHLTAVLNKTPQNENTGDEKHEKLELLKSLVAKGAGISALQYSLRMNKKDIKQLASEHGVRIEFSRPVSETRKVHRHEAYDIDDTLAGHAMHYSSLGYTAPEIAKTLGTSVREVLNIGKAYRIEFRKPKNDDLP